MTTTVFGESQQPHLLHDMKSPKASFRYLRNFLAGRLIGATRDETLLEELLKCLFCKLYLETSPINGRSYISHDHAPPAQFYREVFHRVRADFPEIYDRDDEMLLDSEILQHVMRSLAFDLIDARSDPIGDAFEVFAGSESKARTGQFFTPRNATELLVDMIDPQPGETIIDPACGAGGFLASVIRRFQLQGMSAESARRATSSLYGVEKDEYLSKLARVHISLLSGGHPNVICGDSLALATDSGSDLKQSIPVSGYDVVLTNPPFGVKIIAASQEVMNRFELARRWRVREGQLQPTNEIRSTVPPQVLFVERCWSLLREGGRLGMVIPESLLSNKSYRHVVEYLRTRGTIQSVIGMPEALFKTSGKGGTHTKTCLMTFVKSRQGGAGNRVFMAEARWCGKDSRAREIPQDDLPEIGVRFKAFRNGTPTDASPLGFAIDEGTIENNVLCPRYYDPEIDGELERLSETHHLLPFGTLVKDGYVTVETGDEVGKLAYGTGDIPFVRTSDMSNWEIKADPKHRLDRGIYDALKEKQDVQIHDILMVKDGTYLIGTCGIITESDLEMVYQSHIYKIRTHGNPFGLNQFLLLAILSTDIVRRQIRAKQFTQDIIDSLGERINELVLPVPKSTEQRERITEIVGQVIKERVDARELARRAVDEVLQ